jgi:sigma-B regulation protein RsbU (phosphoserine phosphatase)
MIQSKGFYRSLEKVFAGAGRVKSRDRFAHRIAPALLEALKEPLGITAVHVYERRKEGFAAPKTWGDKRPDIGDDLTRRFLSTGDDRISELPWAGDVAGQRVGLLAVGSLDGPLLVLFVKPRAAGTNGASRAEIIATLNSLLYAMRQHLEKSELHDLIEQARAIQLSLLPPPRCELDGYDIYAASFPASSVGGDLYDYLPLAPDVTGLAVADASGHGLPAALQARDVAVGLRMGVERDLKIVSTIERLNRVVHRSGLTSRFVSLLFGELESNGNFAYVNAGHPPALLVDKGGVRELSVGGMVLGPDPGARFKLGYVHVDRGATMVLYSDGVIERGTTWGEEFGMGRLRKWLKDTRRDSAEAAVENLMNRLDEHSKGKPFEDDVTVMVVRRLP